MRDEHCTFSGEPYRHSSGTYYSPTGLTLDNLYLTTLLQYLTAPISRLKPVQQVPSYSSHRPINYFWWDVRQINEWTSFLPTITLLSGGVTGSLLNSVVRVSSLPSPKSLQDNLETETKL